LIDEIMQVNEVQAYDIGCQLAQDEGILSGISTGLYYKDGVIIDI